jgi:hypothetical protein
MPEDLGPQAPRRRRRKSSGNEKEQWELGWREDYTSGLYETHQSNSGFQYAEIINCFFLFIEEKQVKGDGRRNKCIIIKPTLDILLPSPLTCLSSTEAMTLRG